jgi:hypothetical protein
MRGVLQPVETVDERKILEHGFQDLMEYSME